MVTMQQIRTFRARELSPTEGHINFCPARTASLTASSGLWVLPQLATAYDSLVCHHLIEITPCNIKYVFSEIMIPDHVFDIKILPADYAILQSQASAQLMQEVTPLVSNLEMLPSNFNASLFPILAAFGSSGMNPLQPCKFLFSTNIESGIRDGFSFVVSHETLNPDINTNLFFGRMDNIRNIDFTTKNSKPLPYLVLLDGHSLNFAFRDSVENYRDASELRDIQSCVRNKLKGTPIILGVGYALYFGLKSWVASLNLNALFTKLNPAKEVVKCFAQPVRDILKNLGICLSIIFRASYLDVLYKRVKIRLRGCPKCLVQIKQSVVDFLANLKLAEKSCLLLTRRIYAVFEHLLNNHTLWKYQLIYKTFGGISDLLIPIHPTSKECGLSWANPL